MTQKKQIIQKIGFTGSRSGMTNEQKQVFKQIISEHKLNNSELEFHHGDCLGSDEDAYNICQELEIETICHPPNIKTYRANTQNNKETRKEIPFLDRNKNIVNESDILVATPDSKQEKLRSGTWSTIRYSGKKQGSITIIIFPDGTKKEIIK